MDEEVYVLTPEARRRFRCELSEAEMDAMLARRISWGGLGMYATMCEYEADTAFTSDELAALAASSHDETEAILAELVGAGYVFRTDMMIEGKPAYTVNRDMLPESVVEDTSA